MSLRQGQAKGRWRAVQRAEPPKHASRVWCGHVSVRSWPVDDLAGSDPKPPVAFVQYMSADGKTFYLFISGGDCLSVARGRLP